MGLPEKLDQFVINHYASYSSLTEVEVDGLNAKYGFADGHAYHALPSNLQHVIQDLPEIWKYASSISIPQMEKGFKQIWANAICSPSLKNHNFFSISPTASNSIDIVGAWLAMEHHNVGLLEPVFDNLYLLLKRRGAKIKSIQESDLINLDNLEMKIKKFNLNSLFIVTPNNPTGFELSEDEFSNLCTLCQRMGVSLIVDTTFRFYSKNSFDNYEILNKSGVDYVVVEDTGKTWPTQDMKASLMVYSESLAHGLKTLYEEIFLCSSNFTLAVLGKLIEETRVVGFDKVILSEVEKRREYLGQVLSDTPLIFGKDDRACALPMAWINCASTGLVDLELVQELKRHDILLLPGRLFYWDSPDANTNHVRLSLMRSDKVFYEGLDILKESLPKVLARPPLYHNGEQPAKINHPNLIVIKP